MKDDRGESGLWGLPQCVPRVEPGTSLEEALHVCRLLPPLRLILAWDNGITVCTRLFVNVCVCVRACTRVCVCVCVRVRRHPCMQVCVSVDERSQRHQCVFVYGFAFVWMGTLRHEPSHQPAT